MIKKLYIISASLSVITLLYLYSCKRDNNDTVDCSTYDYSDCNTFEPTQAKFNLQLTINAENMSVPIIIYKGKLEDGEIIVTDSASTKYYDTLLPVDNFYTATAKYKKGNLIIIAVDGGKITKSKKTTCDSVCWDVTTYTAKLKLK